MTTHNKFVNSLFMTTQQISIYTISQGLLFAKIYKHDIHKLYSARNKQETTIV